MIITDVTSPSTGRPRLVFAPIIRWPLGPDPVPALR